MAEPEDKKDPPGEATEEAATQPTPAAPSLPEDMPQTLPGVDASELRMQPVSGEETQAPLPQPADEQAEILAPSAAPPQEPVLTAGAAAKSTAHPEDAVSADENQTTTKQEHEAADAAVLASSRAHTRRAFAVAALATAAGYGFYRWLPRSPENMAQPELLRRTLQANAALSRAVFDDRALAPTYPLSRAESLRVNGVYGLKQALIPESWRLQLVGVRNAEQHPRFSRDVTAWEYRYSDADTHQDQGHDTKVPPSADTAEKMAPMSMMDAAKRQQQRTARMPRGQEEAGKSRSTLDPGTGGLLLTLEDITKLPRRELVTQFKCIEGWSQIVHWAGVRMADFLELYPPGSIDGREPRYVYMETPNGDYYTGYDMHVMRHPQTLLVTEMMGAPLTQFHGAPLRLHMPTKYGYKQIKRIGLISYGNDKPDDYWTKLGYDWYAGL